jgi:MFS transporter, DHA3 family, tetracycline resistance protein
VLAGPITVGLPILARNDLAAGAGGFGLLLAGFSAGSIGGLLLAGAGETLRRRGRIYCLLALLQAPCIAAVAVTPLPLSVAALAGFGLLNGVSEVVWWGLVQERVAPEMFGRVVSIATLLLLGVQLASQLATGFLVEAIGAGPLFLAAGAFVLVASLAGLRTSRLNDID